MGKISHIYKKNKNVSIVATSYLNKSYNHHESGIAKITSLVPEEDWQQTYVPEYTVSMNRKTYTIPEYSIEKEAK